MRTLTTLLVGVALVALAALSFGLSRLDLGAAAVPVALGIASLKAAAIGWFYMHLREQRGGSRLTMVAALSLVAVLIVLVLLEAKDRAPSANVPGPFVQAE